MEMRQNLAEVFDFWGFCLYNKNIFKKGEKRMAFYFDYYTKNCGFWGNTTPVTLAEKYGTPLYVYNEKILRERCRELKNLVTYPNFAVNYSAKANSNLRFLQIVREEGLVVDAMSLGEIAVEEAAGFDHQHIFFISNNVSQEEMAAVAAKGILVSVDSLAQLEMFGQLCPGGRVCVRLNTGVGAGHHAKVVTGGHETKFAIDPTLYGEMREILKKYDLKLVGINQHIGSLFMDTAPYLEGVKALLDVCAQFPDLELIDFGGGFGIPYHKMDGEARLDLKALGAEMDKLFYAFAEKYGRKVQFKVEPGRYISAECCVLLGKVHAMKTVYENKYAGTDLGFNVLIRPAMYDSYHDVEIYREHGEDTGRKEVVSIVGNICESGDILAKKRELPEILQDDIIGVLDAGAYGYAMSSNYNNRLRPAEVLIQEDGSDKLIRRRDTLEDLLRGFDV